MKKSPLKRKSKLKPMSEAKKTWHRLYNEKKQKAHMVQACAACAFPAIKWEMEPHHPKGRQGARIMCYVWLCGTCHQWIHDNGKLARERGMLLPEFDGRKSTPETKNYFGVKP